MMISVKFSIFIYFLNSLFNLNNYAYTISKFEQQALHKAKWMKTNVCIDSFIMREHSHVSDMYAS